MQEAERAYPKPRARLTVTGTALNVALSMNDTDLIRLWLERAVESCPDAASLLPGMLETLGDREGAIHRLRAAFERSPQLDYWIVLWSAYYDEHELALETMRRSPDRWYFWIPLLKPMRETEAFKAIVSDIGLVDYWRECGWGDYCRPTAGDDFECR